MEEKEKTLSEIVLTDNACVRETPLFAGDKEENTDGDTAESKETLVPPAEGLSTDSKRKKKRGKRKKRLKFYQITPENDIKYRGPLSYRALRIAGWVCLAIAQVATIWSMVGKINPQTKLCYMLGSETPFEKNTQHNYDGRHLIYKEINDLMKEFARIHDRILLIDFNDYIRGQEDFTNNINHFQRRVYYEVATKANEYIGSLTGEKLKQKSRLYLFYKSMIDSIGRTGFFQTRLWGIIRKPYVFLKKTYN